MSTKDQATLVGIESIEHASAVLRKLRSSGSSQRKYQTLEDASVYSLNNFNKTVIESASALSQKKINVNARFEGDRDYSESEIIRTKFNTASTDGGDMSGFEYDSFGDLSPQKPSKGNRSLDDLRVSVEFKKCSQSRFAESRQQRARKKGMSSGFSKMMGIMVMVTHLQRENSKT